MNHLLVILVISVAAAGPVHGAQTKCSLLGCVRDEFRSWMQQRMSAPGRRLEGEQGLQGTAQFWHFIEGTLGGLRCYFLVLAGCEGGSALLGFFCFVHNFDSGCFCVLEGGGCSLKGSGDFDLAVLFELPLASQMEIDGDTVDFDFPGRPLGDPPDPGGVAGDRRGHMGCVGCRWVKPRAQDLLGAPLRLATGGRSAKCSNAADGDWRH